MTMRSGNHAMQILQDPKETPKEYLKDRPFTVMRNGVIVNVLEHNVKRNKNFKPTKKMLRGIK